MYRLQMFTVQLDGLYRFEAQRHFKSRWLYEAFKRAQIARFGDEFIFHLRRIKT
jgi:hypothetical protein